MSCLFVSVLLQLGTELLDPSVHKQTGLVTVPLALQDKPHLPGPASSYTEHASDLAEHYFDFLFQGFPQQCGDEKMCKEFEREFEWAGFM